jgi:hypothetical protein
VSISLTCYRHSMRRSGEPRQEQITEQFAEQLHASGPEVRALRACFAARSADGLSGWAPTASTTAVERGILRRALQMAPMVGALHSPVETNA